MDILSPSMQQTAYGSSVVNEKCKGEPEGFLFSKMLLVSRNHE
jgi:hypothetical protein